MSGLLLFLPWRYLVWHFSHSIKNALYIWQTFILFCWEFFSVPLLFKTLLKPWRRLKEHKNRGLDIENIIGVIIVNLVMRAVGFLLRLATIIFGLLVELVIIFAGVVIIIAWIFAPVVVPVLLLAGLIFII